MNSNSGRRAASRTIVELSARRSPAYVPDVNRSSNGEHDVPGQAVPLLLPHDPVARAAPAAARRARSRPPGIRSSATCCSPRSPAPRWRPRCRSLVARSIVRPDPAGRRREPRARRRRDADAAAGGGRAASSPRSRRRSTRWPSSSPTSRESERNFLLSVSHELKTPLTAIRGYAEGLGEGAFTPDEASRTILVEARRLERLVRDLLDLARMNRHEFSVAREPVDLARGRA